MYGHRCEHWEESLEYAPDSALVWRISRLTRNGTAKLVSRNQLFRREGDKGIFPCSADHVNRIGNLPVVLYSAICDDNTYMYVYCCSVYPQLPPVIGSPWGYCGRGFLFPVGYGLVGVQLTRLRRPNQGTPTSECVRKNLNATVLQVTGTMQQSS